MRGVIVITLCITFRSVVAAHGETNTNAVATVQSDNRPDITTLSGVTYIRCRVNRVEPDGISVFHSKGIAKIPFADLSEEYRKKYGYDPTQSSEYSRKMAEANRRAAALRLKQQQEATAAAESERKVQELVKSVKKTAELNAKARKELAAKRRAGRALTSDCRVLVGCTKDEVTAVIGTPSFTGSSGATWFFNNFIDPESGDYETVHLDFEDGTVADVGW